MNGLWQIDLDVLRLPDAVSAIRRLVFHGRVPPARKVNDVVRRGKSDADTARLRREDHNVKPVTTQLEGIHEALARVAGHSPMYPGDVVRQAVSAPYLHRQKRLHRQALAKQQGLLALV